MTVWGETVDVSFRERPHSRRQTSLPVYRTALGRMYCGQSDKLLWTPRFRELKSSVQLVFTSPPFPLNTKKRYGNLQGEAYVRWFTRLAPILRDLVTSNGSIVIEIGNAWEPGRPVMSTIVLRALLKFLEKGGLHLCQEFIWYNPARLPAPIEWVNIERIRVKDAFTRLWWMSPSERPKADNRRVLREYSKSMKQLLASGKYNAGPRPAEYHIGKESFKTDNGGAIPPNVLLGDQATSLSDTLDGKLPIHDQQPDIVNLLKGTNTHSVDKYQLFCRERGIRLHPARMPPELAEFFIRFLTESGDMVFDPFAGSNTTGAVADQLGRQWVSIEAQWSYATSSIARFSPERIISTSPDFTLSNVPHAAASASSVSTPLFTS